MSADGWDPIQYDRFQAERRQPFDDLLALVRPVPGGRAIDLGCGTGELTARLHRHLDAAETLGVDRSRAMLSGRDKWAGRGVRFEERDITSVPRPDERFDVVFANASLQWVDDHPRLLAQLTSALRPGGQLAVQIPANFDHPSHTVAHAVAAEPRFAAALTGHAPRAAALAPEEYAVLLHHLGCTEQLVRLQVYGHLLESTESVVEWIKGTLLTQYRERLDPPLYDAFVDRYRSQLRASVGDQRPYFFAFKRILCWARLP